MTSLIISIAMVALVPLLVLVLLTVAAMVAMMVRKASFGLGATENAVHVRESYIPSNTR